MLLLAVRRGVARGCIFRLCQFEFHLSHHSFSLVVSLRIKSTRVFYRFKASLASSAFHATSAEGAYEVISDYDRSTFAFLGNFVMAQPHHANKCRIGRVFDLRKNLTYRAEPVRIDALTI